MAEQDTELTLSTGKLLGFFFGMVVICGIFFSLGYLVGKGSSQAGAPVMTDSAAASNISSNGGAKPAAGHMSTDATMAKPCSAGDANCTPPAPTSESAAITATPAPPDSSPARDSSADAAKPDTSKTDAAKTSAKAVAPELNSAPQS